MGAGHPVLLSLTPAAGTVRADTGSWPLSRFLEGNVGALGRHVRCFQLEQMALEGP